MTAPIARADLERFQAGLAEKRRRLAKAEHQTRGYRDDDGYWQCGLLSFVRYFWHVLEPDTPFVSGWVLEAVAEHLEAVTYGDIKNLLINVFPGAMKSLLVDVFLPAWEWGPLEMPNLRYIAFSYSAGLTERDNEKFRDLILSDEYQAMYGAKVKLRKIGSTKVSNSRHGWKLATSVGGVGTGERADKLFLDDPHNVKESESKIVITETVRWFRESMSDRLNNIDTGSKIVIMQRISEADVSATILGEGFDYTHLSIAMEFVWTADDDGNPYATSIGWVDPRWTPDPEDCNGALAWEDRFPDNAVQDLKKEKGPYAWCTPAESPVLMGDLSLKPISQVSVGDTVVGFETGNDAKRARHKVAKVLAISRSVQPVYKLTLDSGETARCTADHKWFTGRNDVTHKPYKAARVGSALRRVCPPSLPVLQSEDDIRLAGWVSGFFDGEGTVSLLHRRENEASCLISITQTCERNLPLCHKLEGALTRLGFNYGVMERQPTSLSAAGVAWQKRRSYFLKSDAGVGNQRNGPGLRASRLILNQRFLHVVQPTKWRDRLIDNTTSGRMYTTTERVVSIEPDGVEEVFGLETETGNYVVWGLASSNSAQYQQTPEARGGGLIKRDWWMPAEVYMKGDKFPPFEYIVASLDGAYTQKEENDACALTVWGIFKNERGYNRAMLIDAWEKRLAFSGPKVEIAPNEHESLWLRRAMPHWGLIEWVAYSCKRKQVDRLLIEAKASGISAAQSLRNSHGRQGWTIQLVEPKGDKLARGMAVVPSFSQEMIYAPDRPWAQAVIDDCAKFPYGAHDDLYDSTTQALKHLRDSGLIRSDEELRAEELDAVRHKGAPKGPRYPGFAARRA